MSSAYVRKHCRQVIRPYLRMIPFWLPQTRHRRPPLPYFFGREFWRDLPPILTERKKSGDLRKKHAVSTQLPPGTGPLVLSRRRSVEATASRRRPRRRTSGDRPSARAALHAAHTHGPPPPPPPARHGCGVATAPAATAGALRRRGARRYVSREIKTRSRSTFEALSFARPALGHAAVPPRFKPASFDAHRARGVWARCWKLTAIVGEFGDRPIFDFWQPLAPTAADRPRASSRRLGVLDVGVLRRWQRR